MLFATSKLRDDYVLPPEVIPHELPFICQWILSVLNYAINTTVSSLESYDFSVAANAVHYWWLHQFCDVFVEAIKPFFYDPEFSSKRHFAEHTLWLCLDYGLRLLHPFMPFVTEELWQRLPSRHNRAESIMICEYPCGVKCWENKCVEYEMNLVVRIVRSFRSLAQESLPQNSLPQESLEQEENRERPRRVGFVLCQESSDLEIIFRHRRLIRTLSKLSSICVIDEKHHAPVGYAAEVVDENSAYLDSSSVERSLEKIGKKLGELEQKQKQLMKNMNGSGYKEKVSEAVKKGHADKLDSLEKEQLSLEKEQLSLEATSAVRRKAAAEIRMFYCLFCRTNILGDDPEAHYEDCEYNPHN